MNWIVCCLITFKYRYFTRTIEMEINFKKSVQKQTADRHRDL